MSEFTENEIGLFYCGYGGLQTKFYKHPKLGKGKKENNGEGG